MVSEIWNNVPKNIIAARANIARKAPCSKYLYLFSVHLFTNIIVKLLTNIAHIPSHSAITKIFLLSAKAPITQSNEKLASNTSRYKNNDSHTLWILVIHHLGVCNIFAIPSITTKTTIHRILAIKNDRFSDAGRNIPMIYTTIIAIIISTDLSSHIFCKYLSIYHSRWVSFSASRKKFNATKSKNVPPNHAMVMCEAVSISAYLFGSKIAKCNAAIGLIPHTIATIIRGKIILMPKTAIAIPRVKNLCCHMGVIFFNTLAFTTALSKDKDTSNTPRIITMKSVCIPVDIFIVSPAHKKKAIIIAIIVKIIDPLKYFIVYTNKINFFLHILNIICLISFEEMLMFLYSVLLYYFANFLEWSEFMSSFFVFFANTVGNFSMPY